MNKRLAAFPSVIELSLSQALEVDNFCSGVFSPLRTFCTEADYLSIIQTMKTSSSATLWPIPIVLPVPELVYREAIETSGPFLLTHEGVPLAVLTEPEAFALDPGLEAEKVYGTLDTRHPAIKKLLTREKYAVTGKLTHLARF